MNTLKFILSQWLIALVLIPASIAFAEDAVTEAPPKVDSRRTAIVSRMVLKD